MSAMISSFIYRNSKYSKRKGKKVPSSVPSVPIVSAALRRIPTPPSPASFMSPEIVDINEKSFGSTGRSFTPLQDEEESHYSYDSHYEEEVSTSQRSNPLPSPKLKLEIPSEPMTDWYTQGSSRRDAREAMGDSYELLNASGSVNGSRQGTGSRKDDESREMLGMSPEEAANQGDDTTSRLDVTSKENLPAQVITPLRKQAPTPIRIPNTTLHGPKVHLQRSAKEELPSAQSRPDSPMSADDMSALSGTTLARALIGNSFILSSDMRASRYRSGMSSNTMMRQDSATLPRGENPFLNSPYWRDKRISGGDIILTPDSSRSSAVPPVPPIPSGSSMMVLGTKSTRNSAGALELPKGRKSAHELVRQASTSSLRALGSEKYPALVRSSSSSGVISSEGPNSRRISRIIEVPSPVPSTPGTPQKSAAKTPNDSKTSAPTPSPLKRLTYNTDPPSEYDIATPSPDLIERPPARRFHSDTSLSPGSGQSTTVVNMLDDYMFMSSSGDSNRVFSPMAPESSASITIPVPYRSAPKRASKKRKSTKLVLGANSSTAGKGRVEWVQRNSSESRLHPSSQDGSKVKLLPIGERPGSLLVPQTPITPGSIQTSGSPLRSTPNSFPSTPPSNSSPSTRGTSTIDTPLDSPDVLDSMLAPLSRRMFSRGRSGSTPNPINVVRESKDISQFNITVGPDGESSQQNTPSTGSGHQTFPETPQAFSPLWTSSVVGGSPGLQPMQSLSAASTAVYTPGHSPRSASVSATQNAQITLAQKILLSRATTVSGDKIGLLAPKLHRVEEVPESTRPASLHVSPVDMQPTSLLGKRSSSESSSESIDELHANSRMKPLPPMPPMTPMSASLPQITVEDPQPSPSISITRRLPDISHTYNKSPPVSPPSAQATFLQSVPSPSPSIPRLPSDFTSNRGPTVFSSSSSSLTPVPPQSISPAATPVAEVPNPLAAALTHSASNSIQTSTPPDSRRPSESEFGRPFASSFIAPPPYHTVVGSHANNIHQPPDITRQGSDTAASTPQTPPSGQTVFSSGGSRKGRVRPPLPVGPRKPTSSQNIGTGSLTSIRDRNGSVSSVGSSATNGGPRGTANSGAWRKVVNQSPSPKFQTPTPKYRGYTMETAKWTFTSQQLQTIVSRAIKQSAEASSVRLLRLDTLDTDIPEEIHRLEMQKMDIKTRYKHTARRRWSLLASLTAHADGSEGVDSSIAHRALEELTEISLALDQLAEDLHSVTEQLAQLKSLSDIHSASALAMALRKLNTSFLKQVTESQVLRQRVSSLEAERDEAWKHAEDVALEYDDLSDRFGGDFNAANSSKSPSRRSSRVMAVRKSSIRASKAGLRASLRRSHRSSGGSAGLGRRASDSMPISSSADVPPVPPMPHHNVIDVLSADLPSRSSMVGSSSPSSEMIAMVRAQEELYDMLGISVNDNRGGRPRPRSFGGPTRHSRPMSLGLGSPYPRPVSDISTPGLRSSFALGSARFNRFYHAANDSDAMFAATMNIISR